MKYPVGGGGGGESPALARVSGLRPPVYSVPSLEREEEEEPLRRRRREVPRTLKAVWNGREREQAPERPCLTSELTLSRQSVLVSRGHLGEFLS
jgi:hypothetical protein